MSVPLTASYGRFHGRRFLYHHDPTACRVGELRDTFAPTPEAGLFRHRERAAPAPARRKRHAKMRCCNRRRSGRSAARRERWANARGAAPSMDARRDRRRAHSRVKSKRRRGNLIRRRVRRFCRAHALFRGRTPPEGRPRIAAGALLDPRTTLTVLRRCRPPRGRRDGLWRRSETRARSHHERTVVRAAVLASKPCLTCMVTRLPSLTTLITSICRG